ncbi:nuclear transport factor 2 family protein [Pontibacter roseus]|uniref:nuclear transport factor 2 family protein n=1 Tax=Pontibacter roseus TaxID=336989 RepID=UPI00037F3B4D|nr:nuclear transport factor 2 family protein [Pontibacter roseus]
MNKRDIITRYIQAYNNFDVAGMVQQLHQEIVFRNVAGGEVTLETKGIAAFQEQAERAAELFKERTQQITSISEKEDVVEVSIAYRGVLAVDFSENLKAGDSIELEGKSVFTFRDGKIISMEDIS